MKRKDVSLTRRRKVSVTQSSIKPIRIIIIGSTGVGKSALAVRLLTRRFIGEYDAFLESTHRHQVEIDSELVLIELTDTAGENSATKLNHCLTKADIIMLLFSITDRQSFEEARRIGAYMKERQTTDTPLTTLVGTKRDLEHFREVGENEARELAKQLNSGFSELSISDSEGYQEALKVIKTCIQQYLKTTDRKDRNQKNHNNSSLVKMKEGLIRKTGSFRRKSIA